MRLRTPHNPVLRIIPRHGDALHLVFAEVIRIAGLAGALPVGIVLGGMLALPASISAIRDSAADSLN